MRYKVKAYNIHTHKKNRVTDSPLGHAGHTRPAPTSIYDVDNERSRTLFSINFVILFFWLSFIGIGIYLPQLRQIIINK